MGTGWWWITSGTTAYLVLSIFFGAVLSQGRSVAAWIVLGLIWPLVLLFIFLGALYDKLNPWH